MSNILTIAYATEGSTDQRFLHNIIRKTFEDLALECNGLIDVYEPVFIKLDKKNSFTEDVLDISAQAFKVGMNVLCIHVDADSDEDNEVLEYKINPAFSFVNSSDSDELCKNLVAIIPIHMSEAWMLADKDLLKEEMGTVMNDHELGLTKHPESIANPKQIIEAALVMAQENLPNRRRKLTIAELYQPIGQKISTEKLETLSSYKKFKVAVENALKKLNYLA
jgi:hypothetical protein